MASPVDQLDELVATTFDKVRPVLADQVTREVALTAALEAKSRVSEDGGLTIRRPVQFALNDTVGSYDGYDPINVTPQDGFGYAEYEWKQYAGAVTIDGRTKLLNAGTSRIIDVLAAKFEQLRMSFVESVNTMLWGEGTGNSSKDFLGIQAIVDNTGTLGGIDPSTETWWQSFDLPSVDLTDLDGVRTLNSVLNSLKLAKSRPDLEFADQDGFEAYEALAAPNIRFQDLKMADLGFEAVAHKGAEVVFEDDVPAATWWFINSKHLEYVKHSAQWMKMEGPRSPVNQDAQTWLVLSAGNLITDCRRAHGTIDSVVTP